MAQHRAFIAIFAVALALRCGAAAAHGWDCSFQASGDDPARYVTRFTQQGRELIDPHWPGRIAYRILLDNREFVIAAHAYAQAPAYRREAVAGAHVVIIDKLSGRIRRSTVEPGADEIREGLCTAF
jgi:hypothetical protein